MIKVKVGTCIEWIDGRVIVPEEPVDLPRGRALEVHVRELQDTERAKKPFPTFDVGPDDQIIASEDVRRGLEDDLPVIPSTPGAKPITLEDVQRAEDEL